MSLRKKRTMNNFFRSELMDYFNELWTDTKNNKIFYQTNFDSQQYSGHPQQHLRACVHDFAKCKFTQQEL